MDSPNEVRQTGERPLVEKLGREVRDAAHSISGFLDLAAAEAVSQVQSSCLAHCRSSVAQLLEAVGDLCDDAGGAPAVHTWACCRPEAMVAKLGEWMAVFSGRQNLTFHSSVGSLPVWVETSQDLLEEILYRILNRCVLRDGVRRIAVATTWSNDALQFDFSDFGDLAEAGEADAGLWLRIVRKKLAGAGGDLQSVMQAGAGPVLRLTFPARTISASVQEELEGKGADAADGGVLSLLVVEDNDESFALFEAYVSAEGHRITRARDGGEAVILFKEAPFDLVVMDVEMPTLDGYAATRLIRDWETAQSLGRTPIILLSADSGARMVRMGTLAGCTGFLPKPARRTDLLRALRFYGGNGPGLAYVS